MLFAKAYQQKGKRKKHLVSSENNYHFVIICFSSFVKKLIFVHLMKCICFNFNIKWVLTITMHQLILIFIFLTSSHIASVMCPKKISFDRLLLLNLISIHNFLSSTRLLHMSPSLFVAHSDFAYGKLELKYK